MDKLLHAHWVTLISPLFPHNAEITSEPKTEDFQIFASWLLNNDSIHPDKRSRTVVIEIPKDTINDYSNKSAKRKSEDDKKLFNQAKEFLHALNPNHDAINDERPPEVRLIACGSVLDS